MHRKCVCIGITKSAQNSKSDTGQINEALCKVLAHNICVLVQAIHELGIEPVIFARRSGQLGYSSSFITTLLGGGTLFPIRLYPPPFFVYLTSFRGNTLAPTPTKGRERMDGGDFTFFPPPSFCLDAIPYGYGALHCCAVANSCHWVPHRPSYGFLCRNPACTNIRPKWAFFATPLKPRKMGRG